MRVAVIGGTGFIGRAVVAELESAGHAVLVVHRGQREAEPVTITEHAHVERHDVAGLVAAFDRFGADALVDGIAMTARDADDVLTAVPGALRMLVLSSIDVLRAFGAVHADAESDPLPLDERAATRSERYPYRGQVPGMDDYEKLEVEERFLWRGATVIRLPMVYGEHDPQRREEPILRRLRAGRTRIPIKAGNWLCTRGYVGEMARRQAGAGVRRGTRRDLQPGGGAHLDRAHLVRAGRRGGRRRVHAGAGRGDRSAARSRPGVHDAPARPHRLVEGARDARLGPRRPVRDSAAVGPPAPGSPPATWDADFSADDAALATA